LPTDECGSPVAPAARRQTGTSWHDQMPTRKPASPCWPWRRLAASARQSTERSQPDRRGDDHEVYVVACRKHFQSVRPAGVQSRRGDQALPRPGVRKRYHRGLSQSRLVPRGLACDPVASGPPGTRRIAWPARRCLAPIEPRSEQGYARGPLAPGAAPAAAALLPPGRRTGQHSLPCRPVTLSNTAITKIATTGGREMIESRDRVCAVSGISPPESFAPAAAST